jgi:hypothetical protein
MKTRNGRLFLTGILLLAVACIVWRNALTPLPVFKRVRVVTGLSVTSDVVVEQSEGSGGLFAGAYFRARLRLDSTGFSRLEAGAEHEGYSRLPVPARESAAHPLLARYAAETSRGWYRLQNKADGYSLVILDRLGRTLYVQSAGP